jgi:flagellar biogenesis protein FliO
MQTPKKNGIKTLKFVQFDYAEPTREILMLQAILISLFFFCPTLFPTTTTPLYAEDVIIDQEEIIPNDDNPETYLEEETPHQQVIDVRKLFFKTLLLLIGLCGLVIAGGYLLKRVAGGKLNSFNTNGGIQLVERKYLSPKTSLWLVEVKNKPFVVIDSQHGVAIHSLNEMPSKEDTLYPTVQP